MFTASTLLLSDMAEQFGLRVLRDCSFAYAGKIPTKLNKRLIPCTTEAHINEALSRSGVAGIVTTEGLSALVPEPIGVAVTNTPLAALLAVQAHISELPNFQWKKFKSRIHPTATIYPGAYIAPSDVEIGEGTVVYPNAIIMPRTIIGKHCSIGPGTAVGVEAFEVNTTCTPPTLIKQSGGVHLADHVDIQAKCTIVRSTFGGFTELGEGTKLDCQVHFAHDCIAGRQVRIAACAEISGRVSIGADVFVGPNASISNGISIGEKSKITIGAVVTRDVPAAMTATGHFAVEHKKWISFMRTLK